MYNYKRQKLNVSVAIEAGIDAPSVFEVFPDGTYIPDQDDYFSLTSAAATRFVNTALSTHHLYKNQLKEFNSVVAGTSEEKREDVFGAVKQEDDMQVDTTGQEDIDGIKLIQQREVKAMDEEDEEGEDKGALWTKNAMDFIEASMFELGKVIELTSALQGDKSSFKLQYLKSDTKESTPGSIVNHNAVSPEVMLMEKKSTLENAATMLLSRAKALRLWVEEDDKFCNNLLKLRQKVGCIRRDWGLKKNGRPLVDIGAGEWVPVLRVPYLNVQTNRQVNLLFSLLSVEDNDIGNKVEPIVRTREELERKGSLDELVYRIRLSVITAFRNQLYSWMSMEALRLPATTELTSNTFAIDCGPAHVLQVKKTADVGFFLSGPSDTSLQGSQLRHCDSAVLEIIASLDGVNELKNNEGISSTKERTSFILQKVKYIASLRESIQKFQEVIDYTCQKLVLKVKWSRADFDVDKSEKEKEGASGSDSSGKGVSKYGYPGLRAIVTSTSYDGDGTERKLATLLMSREAGNAIITPALGLMIPAPDLPCAWFRPHCSASNHLLDDVPASFSVPICLSDMSSVLTILCCIRILDELEIIAQISGVFELVDRQAFSLIIGMCRVPDTTNISSGGGATDDDDAGGALEVVAEGNEKAEGGGLQRTEKKNGRSEMLQKVNPILNVGGGFSLEEEKTLRVKIWPVLLHPDDKVQVPEIECISDGVPVKFPAAGTGYDRIAKWKQVLEDFKNSR